ncbi:MAG: tRNA (guanine(10)-N(2))-dimethyltransferase [Candidatus Freyarchaeota archaeon]
MDDYKLRVCREGKVDFYAYGPSDIEKRDEYTPHKAPVFYNPVMKLNRDVAVFAVQAHQKIAKRNLRICEPLAGSGVRGIRFAVEVEGVESVTINDINPRAYEIAKRNVELHNLEGVVSIFNEDANLLLAKNAFPRKRFDVIDIDPFGSPVEFLDSALRALRRKEGLLCLTATDTAPLCGVHVNACIRKYGGAPLRTMYCHEIAVRLLISCAVLTAARREIALTPVLSHSTDHYVRTYLETSYGAKKTDEAVRQVGYLVHCPHCQFRQLEPGIAGSLRAECPSCGGGTRIAGPLWCGKIQSREFVAQTLENAKEKGDRRCVRLLNTIMEEADAPATYYDLHRLCDQLNLPCPPMDKIMDALRAKGYLVTRTHFKNNSLRTDAQISEILKTIQESQ